VIEFGLEVAIRDLSELPEPAPMTEEEALAFMVEQEQGTVEVPVCMDCKQEIPLDAIGVEIEDINGDWTYLENGVQAIHAGTEQEAYLCAECARKLNSVAVAETESAPRIEPHIINTMLGQVSLENHLQNPDWCEPQQRVIADWFDYVIDQELETMGVRIENYVRNWTAPLTQEQHDKYADTLSLRILLRAEKKRRAEKSNEEEPVPSWQAEVEDRGEGDLFGGGVEKKHKPVDHLSAFTH